MEFRVINHEDQKLLTKGLLMNEKGEVFIEKGLAHVKINGSVNWCTGWYDNSQKPGEEGGGVLIYDKDIVLYKGFHYVVNYCRATGDWRLHLLEGGRATSDSVIFNAGAPWELTVVGNIYEGLNEKAETRN